MSKRLYLRTLRQKHAYTIDQLSERAEISYNHYQLIETGKRGLRLSLMIAYKLAKALDITIDEFYQYEKSYLKDQVKTGGYLYD